MSDLNIVHRWHHERGQTRCGINLLVKGGAGSVHVAADLMYPPLPRPTRKYPHPRWCRRCVSGGK